jgi:hypothetical protein
MGCDVNVLRAVTMKSTVFWDLTPRNLTKVMEVSEDITASMFKVEEQRKDCLLPHLFFRPFRRMQYVFSGLQQNSSRQHDIAFQYSSKQNFGRRRGKKE